MACLKKMCNGEIISYKKDKEKVVLLHYKRITWYYVQDWKNFAHISK